MFNGIIDDDDDDEEEEEENEDDDCIILTSFWFDCLPLSIVAIRLISHCVHEDEKVESFAMMLIVLGNRAPSTKPKTFSLSVSLSADCCHDWDL